MKVGYVLWGLFSLAVVAQAQAQVVELEPALRAEVQASLVKGATWLGAHQAANGAWSEEGAPALTALALWALSGSQLEQYAGAMTKAVTFLLSKQQPDGGIYVPVAGRPGSGLGTYNTSVCLAALYATGRPEVMPAVLKAREYVAAAQLSGDDHHAGGYGYDPSATRRYSDLNNTVFVMDAVRRTQGAEELRPRDQKRVDINWEAALQYVTRMQAQEGKDAGGFAYTLQDRDGQIKTNASGRVMLQTYGSISYAGLLALVHARLERSDPRVRSAVEYARRYWTLEENPGQGQQGVYFYYNVMSRALSAAGLNELTPPADGAAAIRWRTEVLRKVMALQKDDGSWVNDNNRWWENDPVLVTAYSMLTLEFAAGLLQ